MFRRGVLTRFFKDFLPRALEVEEAAQYTRNKENEKRREETETKPGKSSDLDGRIQASIFSGACARKKREGGRRVCGASGASSFRPVLEIIDEFAEKPPPPRARSPKRN